MTSQHPITQPAELRNKWLDEAPRTSVYDYLIDKAAEWGADQELEACCALMDDWGLDAADLRAARRPKSPSLKEQALALVDNLRICDHLSPRHQDIIRRALEQLPDAPAVTPPPKPAAAPDRPLWVEMRDVYSDPSRIYWSGHGFARELRVVADWLEATGSRDLAFGVARLRAEADRAKAS